MTTYRVIIEDAMREIGILHKGESADADEIQDGLRALNRMLNSWRLSGIDLEYLSESSVSDALPYGEEDEGPIVYNLAVALAAQFGVKVSPELAMHSTTGYRQIQNKYLQIRELTVDPAIRAVFNPNTAFIVGRGTAT